MRSLMATGGRSGSLRNIDHSPEVLHGSSGDSYAVASQLALKLAGTERQLSGGELEPPQAPCPVGHERAMRRARDRVFGNAHTWSKKTGYEVNLTARRGCNHGKRIQLRDTIEIRSQFPDLIFGAEHRENIFAPGRPPAASNPERM